MVPFLYDFSKSKLWKYLRDENEVEHSRKKDIDHFLDFASELIRSYCCKQNQSDIDTIIALSPMTDKLDLNDSLNTGNLHSDNAGPANSTRLSIEQYKVRKDF